MLCGSAALRLPATRSWMAGTMIGLHASAPGERAVADFGPLGAVKVVFD